MGPDPKSTGVSGKLPLISNEFWIRSLEEKEKVWEEEKVCENRHTKYLLFIVHLACFLLF